MINVNKLSIYLLLIYLSTFVVDAPLRYLLNITGIDVLLYLRDLILIILVILYVFRIEYPTIFSKKIYVILILILCFYSVVGFYFVENLMQVFFTLKLYLPFFLAMGMYETLYNHLGIVKRYLGILFIVSLIGLISNYFFDFPWNDLSVNIGGIDVEMNRNWTTAGFIRPSGFARTSFDLASQLLLLGIFISTYVSKKNYARFIWVLTGIGIILTTTKGIFLSYVVISILRIIRITKVGNRIRLLENVPSLLLGVMAVFPVMTTVLNLKLNVDSFISRVLFSSFKDRIENIWPSVFELLFKDGSIILGRGIGGVGSSQAKFESAQYVSPDNLFLYLFGVFGLFSLLLIIYILFKLVNIKAWRGTEKRMYYEYFVAIFSYGIFSTAIENPFFIFFVGMSFSFLLMHRYNVVDKYKFKLKGAL